MLEAEGLLRIGLRERSRIEARANVRIGPGRMAGARPRSCDKVGELRGRQAETRQIHRKELTPLLFGGTLELLDDRGAPTKRSIQRRKTVRAEDHNDAAAILAQIVYALDQRVHRHLVLVMTVVLGAGSAEAVAFVDDQDRAPMFASGLNDLAKRLCD